MHRGCPRISCSNSKTSDKVVRHGQFFRSSDSKYIQRLKCKNCGSTFSTATDNPCFGHKKRRINSKVKDWLESGVSMRQIARKLRVHRITVARKRKFWSDLRELQQCKLHSMIRPKTKRVIHFDELETFVHTKCKPLSVAMVVTKKHEILGFKVAEMPAKGRISKKAVKKYGARKDERSKKIDELFEELSPELREDIVVATDQNPFYPKIIKRHLPKSRHLAFKSRVPAKVGQGELKEGGFDPLFPINHSFAKLRDLIKPLTRKTWCTVKSKQALIEHLNIYVAYHNRVKLGLEPA